MKTYSCWALNMRLVIKIMFLDINIYLYNRWQIHLSNSEYFVVVRLIIKVILSFYKLASCILTLVSNISFVLLMSQALNSHIISFWCWKRISERSVGNFYRRVRILVNNNILNNWFWKNIIWTCLRSDALSTRTTALSISIVDMYLCNGLIKRPIKQR